MANTRFFLDTRNAKPGAPCVLKIAIAQKKKTAYISLDAKLVPEKEWDSDKVFDGRGVTELRFLCYSDKLLDVVPITLKERSVIRNGVICAIDDRNTADDSELAALRLFGKFVLQISPRRSRIEQVDFLDVAPRRDRLSPVGVKDFGNSTVLVSRGEATITGFLSQQTDDARAVLVENKYGHGEAKVLEVLTDAEEVSGEVIVKEEVIDSRLDRCGGFGGAVLQPRTVADLGVEALAGCQCFFLRIATKAPRR